MHLALAVAHGAHAAPHLAMAAPLRNSLWSGILWKDSERMAMRMCLRRLRLELVESEIPRYAC